MTSDQANIVALIASDKRTAGAFEAMIAIEVGQLIPALRGTVAAGQHRESALIEGKIQALEGLVSTMRRYAEASRPETITL